MISDHLRSPTADWLGSQHDVFRRAFEWLDAMPSNPADGITELDGQDFYVNVHGYATKRAEECRWESHRHTIDLQYCIAGGEMIDWLPHGSLEPLSDYVETKDAEHWRDGGIAATSLRMTAGTFVIFLPNELHRPKVFDGANANVRKLVFKIDARLLGLAHLSRT